MEFSMGLMVLDKRHEAYNISVHATVDLECMESTLSDFLPNLV